MVELPECRYYQWRTALSRMDKLDKGISKLSIRRNLCHRCDFYEQLTQACAISSLTKCRHGVDRLHCRILPPTRSGKSRLYEASVPLLIGLSGPLVIVALPKNKRSEAGLQAGMPRNRLPAGESSYGISVQAHHFPHSRLQKRQQMSALRPCLDRPLYAPSIPCCEQPF